jgi:hypothetical protein
VICVWSPETGLLLTNCAYCNRPANPSGDIIKNKCRSVPKLKVNGVILITEQEKASAIAEKFSRAHENTVRSPLSAFVGESCSVSRKHASVLSIPKPGIGITPILSIKTIAPSVYWAPLANNDR